jgi:hypothetical protein
MLLNYRIAHAKEYHVPRGGQDTGGWEPFGNLVAVGEELNCSECISDERISKWAAAEGIKTFSTFPDSDKKYLTECVSRSFLASFRAKPYVSWERSHYIQAVESCGKQLRH